jgi:Replication-relaxation
VSVGELAALAHLPTDVAVAGLARAGAKAVAPPPEVALLSNPDTGPGLRGLGIGVATAVILAHRMFRPAARSPQPARRGLAASTRQRGEKEGTSQISAKALPHSGEQRAAKGGHDLRFYDLAGRLTERDRTICRLLADHRVLTTEQIADVGFDGIRKTQLRLVDLHRLEVVDRFRPRAWSGSGPYHYVLGPAGAAVVAAEQGVTVADLAWRRDTAAALAGNRQLAHLVGCNGVLTALIRVARTRPGCALDQWWSARRCAAVWGELVRPDAYAVWVQDDLRLPFCLEYDTGTETLTQLAGKLPGFARLAQAVGHPTWVLFAFPTPGREASARRVLTHPEVPVATAVLPTRVAPDGQLWLPVGGAGPRLPLVGLGHPGRHLGRQPVAG